MQGDVSFRLSFPHLQCCQSVFTFGKYTTNPFKLWDNCPNTVYRSQKLGQQCWIFLRNLCLHFNLLCIVYPTHLKWNARLFNWLPLLYWTGCYMWNSMAHSSQTLLLQGRLEAKQNGVVGAAATELICLAFSFKAPLSSTESFKTKI